jgi:tripartite-type tricarboxylate transporter receptor subunit TctC
LYDANVFSATLISGDPHESDWHVDCDVSLGVRARPCGYTDGFPARTVRILVGYVPGGQNDIIARAIGDKLAQVWDKSVIVENVPGASGNIAGDRVAKAPPDGYTLLLANSAQIVVNPSLFEKMSYDPLKELAPVSEVAFTPNLLTVPNDLPVHNVQELIALVRATP